MTAQDGRPPQDGAPARLIAGLSFGYALLVVIALLVRHDLFRDEPDREAVVLWLLVPLVASFGAWMSTQAGYPLLRAWVWFGIVATAFFCWIAVFSFGLLFVPVMLLMMVAAVSPWDKPQR